MCVLPTIIRQILKTVIEKHGVYLYETHDNYDIFKLNLKDDEALLNYCAVLFFAVRTLVLKQIPYLALLMHMFDNDIWYKVIMNWNLKLLFSSLY